MHTNQQTEDCCFKHLFESLEDPVVKFELVDGEPIILDTNVAFSDTFGYRSVSVIDEPLNELIVPPGKQREAQQFDQRTETGESNAAVVERMTEEGKRTFLYRSVPYKDRYGFAIYADITDEMQRERHLDVLHRVLRHNLRNDLTVVLGMTTKIIEGTEEPETKAAAMKIKQTADKLSQLSDEANTIQQVLGETTVTRPLALQPLVDDVQTDCESRLDTGTLSVDVPAKLVVSADDKLRIVLRSLIDNAIRHNDSTDPYVRVSATKHDPTTIELEIVDNGPGIPTTEQRIITDDTKITPLNHGSGLGLWLVKWITDSYGGVLKIETPENGGSIVRLYLNSADT